MSAARLSGPARLLLGSALALFAAPASAEVGATVTLTSQERFRGYSVSDGYPAATFSLSYDDAAGPYVEGSLMVAGNLSDGLERSRFEANAGYALRLKNGPTLDVGIVESTAGRRSSPKSMPASSPGICRCMPIIRQTISSAE